MKKGNNLWIFIVVIIVLISLYNNQESLKSSLYPPLTSKFMRQYHGGFSDPPDGSVNYWSGYSFSNIAILDNYEIVTTKAHNQNIYGCEDVPTESTFKLLKNLQESYIDEDGCQHWNFDYAKTKKECSYMNDCETACGNWFVIEHFSWPGTCNYDACLCGKWEHIGDYGGFTQLLYVDYDCWYKAEIYKDNNLIETVDWTKEQLQFSYDDLFISLNYASFYWDYSNHYPGYGPEWDQCLRLGIDYQLYVPPSFDVMFEPGKIIINNGWKVIQAELKVKYIIDDYPGEEVQVEQLAIPTGLSELVYDVSSSNIIEVTSAVLIYGTTDNYDGVNIGCNETDPLMDVKSCDRVEIKVFEGPTYSGFDYHKIILAKDNYILYGDINNFINNANVWVVS